MTSRNKLWSGLAAAAILIVLVVWLVASSGRPETMPEPPDGTFAFAALGDAPYFPWEDLQYGILLESIDEHDLSWVLNVGDIFWRPCSDELFLRSRDWFNGLRHPVVYTPGDNEWTDCWEPGSGDFAPLERLERLREIFYEDPSHSLGSRRLLLTSQAESAEYPEFVENARWTHRRIVFATVHMVGSFNGRVMHEGRTPDDDEASLRRTLAATAWVEAAFAEAVETEATAVVLAFHANPVFEAAPDDSYRQTYEPFLEALEKEVERFGKPVLAIHGDDHDYLVDRPLARRTTGIVLDNFTRMQVPGSPAVGWVRVVVTPGATPRFEFERYVVPAWKLW